MPSRYERVAKAYQRLWPCLLVLTSCADSGSSLDSQSRPHSEASQTVSLDGRTIRPVGGDQFVQRTEGTAKQAVQVQQDGGAMVEPTGSPGLTLLPSEATRIRYCVSDLFQDPANTFTDQQRVIEEARMAADRWEEVANVRFVYDPDENDDCLPSGRNPRIDLAIIPFEDVPFGVHACGAPTYSRWVGPLPERFFGCLTPPLGGASTGSFATGVIVLDYPDLQTKYTEAAPARTTMGVMVHEMGHYLGLAHEHSYAPVVGTSPWAPSEIECRDELVTSQDAPRGLRQILPYDQASVMHYPWCNGLQFATWEELSPQDGDVMRLLYGPPISWLVGAGVL